MSWSVTTRTRRANLVSLWLLVLTNRGPVTSVTSNRLGSYQINFAQLTRRASESREPAAATRDQRSSGHRRVAPRRAPDPLGAGVRDRPVQAGHSPAAGPPGGRGCG